MSFLTGTNVEVIAASALATATPLASSTTAGTINNGSGAAYLPIGFFNTNSVAKTIKVVADGIFSTTSTPTLKIGVSMDTTLGTINGTPLTFASGAITTATGAASYPFHLDVEITASTFTEATASSSGTTANLMGLGVLMLGAAAVAATTAFNGTYSVGATSLVSVNAYSAQFVEIFAQWGTSSASNTITLERSTIYGCN